jgi:hypothetical protein
LKVYWLDNTKFSNKKLFLENFKSKTNFQEFFLGDLEIGRMTKIQSLTDILAFSLT